MDRTSIIVLIICVAVMLLLKPLSEKLFPSKPMPPGATNHPSATVTSTNTATPAPTTTTTATTTTSAKPASAPIAIANTNIAEELVTFDTEEARYVFSSYGGGLKAVDLQIKPDTRKGTNEIVALDRNSPAAVLSILGDDSLQEDGIFRLTKSDRGVRAEKALTNGLVLIKTFEPTSNYVVSATVRLENHSRSNFNVPVHEWSVGTATPLDARDNGQGVGVAWYNGSKLQDIGGSSYFSHSGFMCMPRTPPREYTGGASNVYWVATHNQYFALAVLPDKPAEAITIQRIDLPRPTGEEAKRVATNAPPPQGYFAFITYPSITLTNGQAYERTASIYAGPKDFETLSRAADQTHSSVDKIMSFGIWGFVSKALLLGMNWMHRTLNISYGWTIVGITVLIKLVFWPLTASSTRSAKRMQLLQPQIKQLQEKYKDDPMKAQKKMMEFYKENKVNPMGSCLPMLIQIPVFFGFLTMIRSAIELRGAHWLWVQDLAKPDTLFWIGNPGYIPFIGAGLPFNLLPLIMGATMLWQARLTPPSPGMDQTQQAIMKYLPLIFLVSLYNFSAAMTLYWTTNNLLTILQTKLTKTIRATPATPAAPQKPAAPQAPQKKQRR